MAVMPPSTNNSSPFAKLESSEARNSATVATSSGWPIFPRGIRDSKYCFASLVRTASCIGVAIAPGTRRFTRIFLSFSSLSHVRAKERNANLLAAYTLKPGKPFAAAFDPVMKIDPPSFNSGNAFCTVKRVPRTFRSKVLSKWCSVIDLALFPLHDVEQPVEVVEIGRVTLDAGYIPADYLHGLVDLLLLPARDENVSTLLHEELGACQRHAARPTCDDCNLTFKLSHN